MTEEADEAFGLPGEVPDGLPLEVPSEALASVGDFRGLLLGDVPLIDVRAPVEFARGAFPNAVNLPLMTDEERHLVGLRHKRAGQHKAIELGAELVDVDKRAERVVAWSRHVKAHPDAVLYCLRGGLRSRIAQRWLADSGAVRPLVAGGYKALRQYLIDELARLCRAEAFLMLAGRTGSGKTLLLKRLPRHVDLERIAHHRGSSFGNLGGEQPSAIDVENRIAIDLLRLERAAEETPGVDASGVDSRVWLEDEGKLIGRVCLPLPLREAMAQAPAVVLETPLEQRLATCFDDYVPDLLTRYRALHAMRDGAGQGTDVAAADGADVADLDDAASDDAFDAFAEHHRSSLARIRKRFGAVRHAEAAALLEAALAAHREHGDTAGYGAFIELLLTGYYDPMYDYQLAGKRRRVLFRGDADAILAWAAHASASDAAAAPPRAATSGASARP